MQIVVVDWHIGIEWNGEYAYIALKLFTFRQQNDLDLCVRYRPCALCLHLHRPLLKSARRCAHASCFA